MCSEQSKAFQIYDCSLDIKLIDPFPTLSLVIFFCFVLIFSRQNTRLAFNIIRFHFFSLSLSRCFHILFSGDSLSGGVKWNEITPPRKTFYGIWRLNCGTLCFFRKGVYGVLLFKAIIYQRQQQLRQKRRSSDRSSNSRKCLNIICMRSS